MIVDIPAARTIYQFDFFFLKEAKDIEVPMVGGNTGLGYEVVDSENKLNPTASAVNIAEAAINFDERDGQKNTKKNRRKTKVCTSSHSISTSMYFMSISEKSTNEEEYTLESVYSSVSSSASKSDELQSVATTSTQCVIENNNQNRLARLDGLPIGEGDILTVIISRSSNYTSKVCRRQN